MPPAKHWVYVLRLAPRLHDPAAWTDADRQSVAAHFERLQAATAQGQVILAGRTDEPLDTAFGLVVFQAADDAAAQAFMAADTTVRDGVMTAQLHPYALALLRGGGGG
jgi:uncharacterized protein YciI